MNKLHKQIEQLTDVVKRHEKFPHFSGIACILTGAIWILNEVASRQLYLTDNYRVISWLAVSVLAVLIATFLTIYEGQKRGKIVMNLSLISIMDKLIIISISTIAIIWTFYSNSMIDEIPSLLMVMYSILILTSKQNMTKLIYYFGMTNLVGGVVGLLFVEYSIVIAAIILGGGHIILGILLILNEKRST
jgi:membrane-associated HD superfamily phosphohydrolase